MSEPTARDVKRAKAIVRGRMPYAGYALIDEATRLDLVLLGIADERERGSTILRKLRDAETDPRYVGLLVAAEEIIRAGGTDG